MKPKDAVLSHKQSLVFIYAKDASELDLNK